MAGSSGLELGAAREEARRSTPLRRLGDAVKWAMPSVLLVLMPKCPLCVAAYVALFTGVGISISTAAHLRMLMLVLCVVTLGFLTVKLAVRTRRTVHGI